MELFEKVDYVFHYSYEDSNGGPLNFVKIQGELLGPTNGDLLGDEVISDLVIFHLRKKRIRLEKIFKLPEINSL